MKYLVLILLMVSCLSKSDSPEAALKEFIDNRLEKIVSKDFILDRTTGALRTSLESMNEEEFSRFADLRGFKKDSFKILSKNCQDKKCYVTYSLGYHQKSDASTSWQSEVKKIAEILWIEGKWLIADVSNIKTYHEASQSIEINP